MPIVAPLGGRRRRAHHRAVLPVALAAPGRRCRPGACGGGDDSGTPTLTWYTNPDNGGQEDLAEQCTEAADGAYRIEMSELPPDADSQREQLVRRLAANDSSIDLMSLDPVFVPEFAEAGFLRPVHRRRGRGADRRRARRRGHDVDLERRAGRRPVLGQHPAALVPQVGRRAGRARPREPTPVTWDQIIDAAEQTGTTVDVTGARYEGYMVWINSLVASAGGQVLEDPGRRQGRHARPSTPTPGGQAAEIIRTVARNVAAPGLSTAIEEDARAAFQSDTGGFMVNWPYVYGAVLAAVEDGSLDQAVVDDIGWARVPRVDEGTESAPPLGGINIGIGAFGKHQDVAVDAVQLHHQRGEPDGLHAGRGQPGGPGRGVRRPRDRREVPDGRPDPRPRSTRRRPARRARTTPTSARPRCASSTRRPRSTPTRRRGQADDLIVNVLQDRQLL